MSLTFSQLVTLRKAWSSWNSISISKVFHEWAKRALIVSDDLDSGSTDDSNCKFVMGTFQVQVRREPLPPLGSAEHATLRSFSVTDDGTADPYSEAALRPPADPYVSEVPGHGPWDLGDVTDDEYW